MPSARVVWREGMHLSQHHFQAQSRHFEDEIHFAIGQLFAAPYGLAGIELDAEALRNGTVRVVHARGVMPDGLAFNLPESDAPPDTRELRDLFSPTRGSHVVSLAVPAWRPGGANAAANGGAHASASGLTSGSTNGAEPRYRPHEILVPDELTGIDRKPVQVGRKNFRLRLDVEADEAASAGEVALPIARVRRDGAGHFVYDADFIPPCLQIGASARLVEMLHRLVEMLDARGQSLREGLAAEGAAADVASRWLLHTVASASAPLRHLLHLRRARPDALYLELVRLAGALSTFALDAHPRDLPPYDHDRPEDGFAALDRFIRAHLGAVAQQSALDVPLHAVEAEYFTAALADERVLGAARWVLGVRLPRTGLDQPAAQLPQLVRVCSAKFIKGIVARGYPGLALEFLPNPPAVLAPRPGTFHFTLDRRGPCWDTIQQTREVGVHVPAALAGAELELKILLDG